EPRTGSARVLAIPVFTALGALTVAGAHAQSPKSGSRSAAPSASASASAAPQAPPAAPAPPRPSIARITEALARDLATAPSRALVVASQPSGDVTASRGAELSALLASQLAGRRGKGTRARAQPGTLADGRVAAGGESALVYLGVRIAEGGLSVTADVYPVP